MDKMNRYLVSWTIVVATLILTAEVVNGRRSGGSSSSRSSSSSSRSSWGSSSRSGSSRTSYSSPSSSSSYRSTRYSSSPSSYRRYGSSGSSDYGSPSPSYSSSSWSNSPAPSPPFQRSVFSKATMFGGSSPPSSKWGSSSPSGSRPASDYAVAGRSAFSSAVSRPLVNPSKFSASHTIPVVTNPSIMVINNYRSPGYSDNSGFYTGYLLGRVMSSSGNRYHNEHYYGSYVPYRQSYRQYDNSASYTTVAPPAIGSTTGSSSLTTSTVPTTVRTSRDYCTLARWNMELPFSELPNMALQFLINDSISGSAVEEKSRFMYGLLNDSLELYGDLPASADVFQVNSSLNFKKCKFQIPNRSARYAQMANNATEETDDDVMDTWHRLNQVTEDFFKPNSWMCQMYKQNRQREWFPLMPDCDQPAQPPPPKKEEPFVTSINNMLTKYSNASNNMDLLSDLVRSAKACYNASRDINYNQQAVATLHECLDFSIDVTQMSEIENDDAMFGNEELCRKYLNPNVARCLNDPSAASAVNGNNDNTTACSLSDLTNLLVFARNFYVCSEPVGSNLLNYAISIQPTTTTASTTSTTTTTTTTTTVTSTTVKPPFWSKLFG